MVTISTLIFVVFVAFNPNAAQAQCSRTTAPCEYTCHCESSVNCPWYPRQPCAPVSACARGWSGSTCQRENIALDSKNGIEGDLPILGSSRHNETNHPALAFDGNTSTTFATDPAQDNPYLWVNLRKPTSLTRMQIYTNDPQSIAGFRVEVASDASFSSPARCYTSPSTFRYTAYEFSCTQVGQYVRVLVPRKTRLIIQELAIYRCADYWYNSQCNLPCNCQTRTEICNPYSGTCKSGCLPGYYSSGCQTVCPDGKYGSNCAKTCGYCAGAEPCNKANGSCPRGCDKPGFKPPLCQGTSECPVGRYGLDCSGSCDHCGGSGVCDKETGRCLDGCKPGYRGFHCNQECQNGAFGENCQHKCNCFDSGEICDSVTGTCQSGCDHGYHGNGCLTACPDGKFGRDCQKTCRCFKADEVCNHVTGVCSSGCADGYVGEGCVEDSSDENSVVHIGVPIALGALCLILALILVWAVIKWRQNARLNLQKGSGYENRMGPAKSGVTDAELYEEVRT